MSYQKFCVLALCVFGFVIINSAPTENKTNSYNKTFHRRHHLRIAVTKLCPENMQPFRYSNITTETVCDCKLRFLYYPVNDSCYEAYRQGPCEEKQYLILQDDKKVACVKNPCGIDGHVPYNGTCYPLQHIDGPCGSNKVLNVNTTSFHLECMSVNIVPFIVIQFPKDICPSGTRRNALGICKEPLKQSEQ